MLAGLNLRCCRFRLLLLVIFTMETLGLATERQITSSRYGHILTNTNVWSPDGKWIVYDVRSDPAGEKFDGTRIERVHADTGEVQVLFQSQRGANCGVATFRSTASSTAQEVVFIHGPHEPSQTWSYSAFHRRGVIVKIRADASDAQNLDARNLVPPFTPGALRGGTHVHTFSPDGEWVAFTYEDHVLATTVDPNADANQRNVGVSVAVRSVNVPDTHPRNHNGSHFSVLVTRTVENPRPGSDEIEKAFSDAWIGESGYIRLDGVRQRRAIAFQGHVRTSDGATIAEVFVVDMPDDVTRPSQDGPLEGSTTRRPLPPLGVTQRRLTFTEKRKYPGIQGVRHWLRSAPDGSKIAFLMKDESGVSQLWTVSPNGGEPRQVTHNQHDVSSSFTWSCAGKHVAHTTDGSVCITEMASGITRRLTQPNRDSPLRPEACVFSPDGQKIAYVRRVKSADEIWNQIFVVRVESSEW